MTHLLCCLPWLALLGGLAGVAEFFTDDAFISFRYARNLIEGNGLVFNPGEYVEGYTNFLWILELAAIWGILGVRPEDAAPCLSVGYTGGTVAVMLWWIARMPSLPNRGLVAWMGLGLVCSSATFAVWTSGGGLETRQFTFFIVVAVVCLGIHRDRPWGLLIASLSLAAAALTRPEGLMLAACCFGWFAAHRLLTDHRLDWREAIFLTGPFFVLIAAHFLFRYGYYGAWLPNTYYAKHVRPWYESGFRYLWAAVLETGLYLLIPLACVAVRKRWIGYRDGTYALGLLCISFHVLYLMRIGGDVFEYRPLDFYWPLLAVPGAEGITHLASGISNRLRTTSSWTRWAGPRAFSLVLFVPVLFYAGALQGALLFKDDGLRFLPGRLSIELNEKNAAWLLTAPGMPALVAISNALREQSARQFVGLRAGLFQHALTERIAGWKEYEKLEPGVIPDNAVAALASIGVSPYYLRDLTIIDVNGLADATVAHNPVTRPNHERIMAHDRFPPPGYLQRRGVNFRPYPSASNQAEALASAHYALKIGPELWMPFSAGDHQWINEHFVDRDLRARSRFSMTRPADNRFSVKPYFHFVGEQFLGRFEGGMDGWQVTGEAMTNHGQQTFYTGQLPIFGHVGPGFLTSYHPDHGDKTTGKALSPAFTAKADQSLVFLLAGGSGSRVGLRLLADGEETAVWYGAGEWSSPSGERAEEFDLIVSPLSAVAGKRLQLELFDHERSHGGHIMLDHVMLARPSLADLDRLITEAGQPILRSKYDIYINKNALIYVKEPCGGDDMDPIFFLHLIPVDENDLPDNRQQYGFDNLDFRFTEAGRQAGQQCLAIRELPKYALRSIRTGQYVPGAGPIWEGRFSIDE